MPRRGHMRMPRACKGNRVPTAEACIVRFGSLVAFCDTFAQISVFEQSLHCDKPTLIAHLTAPNRTRALIQIHNSASSPCSLSTHCALCGCMRRRRINPLVQVQAHTTNIRSKMLTYTSITLYIAISILCYTNRIGDAQLQFKPQPNGLQRSQSQPNLNSWSDSRSRPPNQGLQRQSSFSNSDHCKTNYKYDYVQLTLQWAPGVCSTSPRECTRVENRYFTIHGMWPTITGTQEPANCCFDNTFNYPAVKPIEKDLDNFWFSYFDSNSRGNRHFWAHEWLKHGTCSRDVAKLRGELPYFQTTLQMAKQMNTLNVLSKSGIVPNDQKSYASGDIVKALQPLSQNKTVTIDCDFEHNQPIPIMTGVNFCFDSELKPKNCPPMRRKCQGQVYFRANQSRLSPQPFRRSFAG